MSSPPSVCFVAHNALGALTGRDQRHVGGIERQQATMATWLAARGWDVSMITWDDGRPTPAEAGGVRIVPLCGRDAGLPGLRFVVPRWSSLVRALRRARADVYYYNCGDLALGQIVLWARASGKAVVYSVASDPDCDPELPVLDSVRERVLYRYGLRHCRHIIVQSRTQQRLLEQHYAKQSTVLPMPCRGFPRSAPRDFAAEPFTVFWAGRISPEKRVEWLLEAARRLPGIRFRLAGAPNKASAYARDIESRAAGLPNVTLLGRVPYERMAEHYHAANLLCCTSVYEGFPNVFLEAWSAGLPVVTTCDPDGTVAANALGSRVDSVDSLVAEIDALCRQRDRLARLAQNALDWFAANHTPETAMPRFAEYFEKVHGIHSMGGHA
jgi:glycosyltransferase involved in cell wall biosynthesis